MKLLDLILENQSLFNLLSENGRIEVLRSKFVDSKLIDEKTFEKIVNVDPTRNKTYVQWLLNQYVKEVVKPNKDQKNRSQLAGASRRFLEDMTAVTDFLTIFNVHKAKFPKKDINQYTVSEFIADGLAVDQKLSDSEKSIAKGEHKYSADEKKYPELQIGKVAGYTVWKFPQGRPDLNDAAVDLSGYNETPRHTNWCTGYGAFKDYSSRDPLYIFIGNGRKYQFHFQGNEFKNESNLKMSEGPLKDAFLKFLEDREGRVPRGKDIRQNKIGEYDTPNGKLPLYKVGENRYYTSIDNREVFYNPEDGLLKSKEGMTISRPTFIFSHPYMDFLKEVYKQLKQKGDVKRFRGIYRLLLGLDVPQAPESGWVVPRDLTLAGTQLTEIPEDLHIKGNFNLDGSPIVKLPSRLRVDGDLDLTDTGITEIPPGVKVGGKIEGLKEKSK